jgi:GNAT superfamily N-acetyltransferase
VTAKFSIAAPSEADLDVIHRALAETYWSPGVPREVVARAFAQSLAALARDEAGALIGFARIVTDRATFAWLADVVVLPGHGGKGLARAMVAALRAHPDTQQLRRWLLATRDAHGVYEPLGFAPLAAPERFMEIKQATPYGRASS